MPRTKTGFSCFLLTAWLLSGCSYFLLEDIHIPMNFVAVDSTVRDTTYAVDGRKWVWQADGVKIEVEQMTDPMLNALFPGMSNRGLYSTNPFTFGNWVDLEKGYTPAKFTVFTVRIFNYTQPKVEMDPRTVSLKLDNGASLASYGLTQYEDPPSLEQYFIAHQGASGNERRRFKEKLGKAKQTMLVKDPIFKGNSAEGLIVFDPLPPEVKQLTFVIKDFVMRFDANDWPLDTRTLEYPFSRRGNVEATANEIKLTADSSKAGSSVSSGAGSGLALDNITQDLEIRNLNAYNNLLGLIRSDNRFQKAVLDLEISATGSVALLGFLASTGDQNLDDHLKRVVEEMTFAPIRTLGSQGYYIPVPVRFVLHFGLSPMLPRVKVSPGKVDVVPAIGVSSTTNGTIVPATRTSNK